MSNALRYLGAAPATLLLLICASLLLAGQQRAAAAAQDVPTPIPGKQIPKKAECVICTARGTMLGEMKVVAGSLYKGKAYYFCVKSEVAEFARDPESFLPRPLPRSAPAFSLPVVSESSSRNPTSLADLSKGRVLLVDFWATWCGPCVAAMPELQKLHDKYSGKGFAVVGISVDEEGGRKVAPFLAKRKPKITYPILLDTGGAEKGVWKQWGVVAVPAAMLVKDGQIIGQWTGRIDLRQVEKAVNHALGTQ